MKSASRTISAAPRKASPGSRYKVPNLERGLMILEHLMDHQQGLQQSEIAARLRYSKTSVFRVTMTLLEFGYLVRDPENKALRLSRKLLALGNRALGDREMDVQVQVCARADSFCRRSLDLVALSLIFVAVVSIKNKHQRRVAAFGRTWPFECNNFAALCRDAATRNL